MRALSRMIRERGTDLLYVCGPGHGGPAMVANSWLEGTYSEIYPEVTQDEEGMRRLFRQFSFPGGIPSHAAPETPGAIHEGEELVSPLVHHASGADPVEAERREAEIDRDATALLPRQAIRVDAGERAHERGLAVIDVARRAENHRIAPLTSAPLPRAPWRASADHR